jgi:hypothetical protein
MDSVSLVSEAFLFDFLSGIHTDSKAFAAFEFVLHPMTECFNLSVSL